MGFCGESAQKYVGRGNTIISQIIVKVTGPGFDVMKLPMKS